MALTLHLLRKDLRQFRIMLAVWLALLALNLGVDLGWVGQVGYSQERGFDQGSNTWTSLLPTVIWLLTAMLPSLVVVTDSPARREGFLATRPMPKSDVFLAKLLFILLLIILPWVLVDLIHLMVSGVPGWVVSRGTLERLMYAIPLAFGFGAYAALWPDVARWARSLAIIVGGYILLALTMSMLQIFFGPELPVTSSKAPTVVNLFCLMAALVGFSIWHSRAHRGVLARWGGLILVVVILQIPGFFWPWHTFALQPADPASANAIMNQADFTISPRNLNLAKVQRTDRMEPQFSINLAPKTKPMPGGYALEWSPLDAKILRLEGNEIQGRSVQHAAVFGAYYYWATAFDYPDALAWSPEFPPDILFRKNNANFSPANSVYFPQFPLPASPAELTEPMLLQAGLEARVFKWTKIADLALTPGATSTDEYGSWKFVALRKVLPGQGLYLQRQQIELATASDSRCSSAESGPLSRMAYLLYDPLFHEAWMPDSGDFDPAKRGGDTAVIQYFRALNFSYRKPLTPAEQARCRLIIFQKTWVGSVRENWQSPTFTLEKEFLPTDNQRGSSGDPMPHPEFERRLAALKIPAVDAPRRDISLYLLDVLRLVDSCHRPMDHDDPHTLQLAAFIPDHLDLLLDGLPVMEYPSRETVLNVIALGATEAQEPAIIAGLKNEPELAGVLLARGWVPDARKEILQLAQYPRNLPLPALQAMAWFQATNTYPRLLEEFEANPTPEADDALRTLPGLDASLDDIINRHWHEESLIYKEMSSWEMFGESFQLALRQGQTSALQRACLLLADPDFNEANSDYYLANAFRDSVWMPDLKPSARDNDSAVIAWIRKHRPDDFVYNPALRQFIPKADPSGNPLTAATQP